MARTARLALEVDSRGARRGASEADRELRGLKKSARDTTNELRGLSKGADGLGQAGRRGAVGMRSMRQETDRAGQSFLRARIGSGGLATSLVALKQAAAVLVTVQLGRYFLDIADKSKRMEAVLKLAIPPIISMARAQADVSRIARTTRGDLESTAELYGKFSRQAAEMGKSQDQASRATETFIKTLKISGAAATEVESVTRQFGQALASGVLRGDEFNSVMENSPRLARLLADSLQKPVGALRKMAEEGKLSADLLFGALTTPKFTEKIDNEFKQIPATFGEAMVLVKNSMIETFGAFDRGGQFSNAIIDFVTGGSDGFADMQLAAEDFGVGVRAILTGLVDAWTPFFEEGKRLFALLGVDFDKSVVSGIRDAIAEILGAVDILTGIPASVGNWWNGNRPNDDGQRFSGSNLSGRFQNSAAAVERSGKLDQQDRKFFNNIPVGFDFRAPGAAQRFVRGETFKRGPVAKPEDDKAGATKTRTNVQVLRDFERELNKLGVKTLPNAVRSAQRQNELFKQKLTPLDGYTGISRHQSAQAIDYDRSTFDQNKVNLAAQRAGLKGFETITESGGRKHSEWTGAGKPGDLSGFLAQQEKAEEVAKRRAEQEQNFWDTLRGQADTASMMPIALEQYNEEAKLRKIINDGNLGVEKDISAEQRLQIEQELERKRLAEFKANNETRGLQQAASLRKLEAEAAVMGASNRDNEAENMQVMLAGLDVKEDALAKGLKLTDATVVAAVAEAEARERQLAATEKKNAAIARGNALTDELNDKRDPAGALRREFERSSADIGASTRPQGEKDSALKQLTEDFNENMQAVRQQFYDKILNDINQVGEAIGGAFGSAVQSAMTIAANFAQMSEANYKPGTVGAQANNPISKVATGLQGLTTSLSTAFGLSGKSGKLASDIGGMLGAASDGANTGTQVAGIAKALGIKKFSTQGAQLGGAAGGAIGMAVGGPLGSMIGQAAGSVLGGVIGGLFKKKAPSGSSTVTSVYADPTFKGNSKVAKESSGAARSIQEGLIAIADQFNAQIGTFAVSIGKRDGDYRVDPTGRGSTKIGGSVIDFDDDLEGAVKFAIVDAIKDGALKGLSATVEKMLKSATPESLDRILRDMIKLNNVQRGLKAIKNPVGLAVDDLNKDFSDIKSILDAYGGTLQEYADAEELYQIRRKEIIEQGNSAAIKAMRDYLFQLRGGTGSALSPELRYQTARAELTALDTRIAGGENVDFQTYQSVADAFLSASRESQGSTMAFFTDLRRVTDSIASWIERDSAAALVAPPIDFTPVVAATATQTTVINGTLNSILDTLIAGFRVTPGAPTGSTTTGSVTVPVIASSGGSGGSGETFNRYVINRL